MVKKSKRQAKINHNSIEGSLLFYGLLLLLFYPPFFRGLFFNKEMLITHILTGILFLALIYFKPGYRSLEVLSSPIDYGALLLFVAYILAALDSVVPRDAVKEILRIFNYIVVFLVVGYFARSFKNVKRILMALYLSGFCVAAAGLLAAVGLLNIKGLTVGNRIYSTLQYPNTLAAYLIAVFLIGLYLAVLERNTYKAIGYNIANYLIFLTVLGTQSRGGLLLFPVSVLLLLAGPVKNERFALFRQIMQHIVMGLPVYVIILSDFTNNPTGSKLAWVFTGAVFITLIEVVSGKLAKLVNSNKLKYVIPSAVVFLLLVVTLVYFNSSVENKITPAFSRLANLSENDSSLGTRLTLYNDAVKVIKDNPLLGTGGGGWAGIYKQYRSFGYNSKLIHNHFLEVLVEAGAVGFIAYLLVWIGFLCSMVKIIRNNQLSQFNLSVWVAFCAAFTIGLHSAIDFNLSLGAVSIFLWCMFGLVRGVETEGNPSNYFANLRVTTENSAAKIILTGVTTIFVIFSTMLYSALANGTQGIKYLDLGQYALAEPYVEKAAKYDPLSADFKMAQSHIWVAKAGKDRKPKALENALEYAERTIALEPHNPDKHIVKGNIHLNMGQADQGVKEYETALKLDPVNQKWYDSLADIYLRVGEYYAYLGKKEKAKEYYKKAISVPGMIEQQAKKMNLPEDVPWMKQYELKITENIKKIVSEAEAGLKKLETK